jgi:hypothetical protein
MIQTADFAKWASTLLDETFGVSETSDAYFLDSNRSGLLATIDALSAEQASAVYPPEQLSIAAHCGHVLFLLNQFISADQGQAPSDDWAGSWATRTVDSAAWQALRGGLREAYGDVAMRVRERGEWPEPPLAATMILLAHCNYHVGQVRQLLTFVAA